MIFKAFSRRPPPVTTSARCVGLKPLVFESHSYFRPRDEEEETVNFGLKLLKGDVPHSFCIVFNFRC
jgi:hypothetical protein